MKMVNKIKLVMLLTLSYCSIACHSECATKPDQLSESFKNFEHRFNTDSLFRSERTVKPLPGYNSDEDDGIPADISTSNEDSIFYWDDSWEFYYTELLSNENELKVDYNVSDRKVVKKITVPNSGFNVQLVYELKANNEWFLTYFWYQNE